MQRRTMTIAALGIGAGVLVACGQGGQGPRGAAAQPGQQPGQKTATIELERGGSITIQLFPDVAPKTVENFEKKANAGFYNGLTFHRVEDWVVQGGDPAGNGTGGNQTLPTEVSDKPFGVGAVGVARRAQPADISNDAQFFICTKDAAWLNKQYTNFGQVTAGMDVVQSIERGDKIKQITVRG